MQLRRAIGFLACLLGAATAVASQMEAPNVITVKPVFFVPTDQSGPTRAAVAFLAKHLETAQGRYAELLRGDTFGISGPPEIVKSAHGAKFYLKDGGRITEALFARGGFNRFNCPYVYLVVLMAGNPHSLPVPGGYPFNGGDNRGGGTAFFTWGFMTRVSFFQSTLQHELGHAFGLGHPADWGLDQKSSMSIMSYNTKGRWKGLQRPARPLYFIPEDLRELALNRRVFARFQFDPKRDVPAGYEIKPGIGWHFPARLPNQRKFEMFNIATKSGETWGSTVRAAIHGRIDPGGPGSSFHKGTMWHSARSNNGWVALDWTFPYPASLTSIRIHTEHSGKYHRAEGMRLEAVVSSKWVRAAAAPLDGIDHTVRFPRRTAMTWRLHLKAGPSRQVVVRGLQFYNGDREIMPPAAPLPSPPR